MKIKQLLKNLQHYDSTFFDLVPENLKKFRILYDDIITILLLLLLTYYYFV